MMMLVTLQTVNVVIAATLVVSVMAERDVVIKGSVVKNALLVYDIEFSSSHFTQFHNCLATGYTSCRLGYSLERYPMAYTAQSVTTTGNSLYRTSQYYTCEISQSHPYFECTRQAEPQHTDNHTQTYRNLMSFPSVCVGFVWAIPEEGITFNTDQIDVELCNADCTCPSRSTTPPSAPTSASSSLKPSSLLTAASSSLRTNHVTSPLRTNTKPVTAVSTSGTDNPSDDTPVGAIVGAVLGVIIIILIIVVMVLVYRRRRENPRSSDNSGPGKKRVPDFLSSHTHTDTGVSGDTGRIKKKIEGKSPTYLNAVLSENTYEIPNDGVNNAIEYQNVL